MQFAGCAMMKRHSLTMRHRVIAWLRTSLTPARSLNKRPSHRMPRYRPSLAFYRQHRRRHRPQISSHASQRDDDVPCYRSCLAGWVSVRQSAAEAAVAMQDQEHRNRARDAADTHPVITGTITTPGVRARSALTAQRANPVIGRIIPTAIVQAKSARNARADLLKTPAMVATGRAIRDAAAAGKTTSRKTTIMIKMPLPAKHPMAAMAQIVRLKQHPNRHRSQRSNPIRRRHSRAQQLPLRHHEKLNQNLDQSHGRNLGQSHRRNPLPASGDGNHSSNPGNND